MNQAVGLVEVQGYAAAIMIADTMAKVAAVEMLGIQRAKGFGWMTVEVCGDVGAVKAAVDAAKAKAVEESALISALVIPRPATSLDTILLNQVDYPKVTEDTSPEVIEEIVIQPSTEDVNVEKAEVVAEMPIEKVVEKQPATKKKKTAAKRNKKDKK
ncbi:ethanolamine utilization protein EutM [Enterococcus sp. PF1-24]|uniref:BMC domain-containing protein n=1 Tax=unclassified Enterococcus TaxID=2608891 RepID=UPI002476DEC7|nr:MULTISPECIES: BMC domain-containing protein [unclassified Enterococcus]MDH6365453.1 ethanolamine utilization protein EutM [Enterococcus sp. PFB1-1]MDH6402554.1 ethanolamine utilization protein EutM [Enterococcus sp. PF1-24]